MLIPRAVQGLLLYWTYSTEHPRSILVELWNSGWHGSGAFHITIDPHTWLDGLGLALVAGGVALSMASRSASSKEAIGDRGFRRYVLLPVIAGGFLLLMQACSWLSHGERPTLTMLSQWVVLGGIAFVCIRVLAWAVWAIAWALGRADATARMRLLARGGELVAQGVAGAVVGLLIWSGLCLWHGANGSLEYLGDVAVFGLPWLLMSFLAGQIVLSGLTSRLFSNTGDRNREWLARASGWYGAAAIAWLGFAWLVIYGWQELQHLRITLAALTAGSGVLTLLGGSSPVSQAIKSVARGGWLRGDKVIALASGVFIFCVSVLIAASSASLLHAASSALAGAHHPWLERFGLGTLQPVWLDSPLPPRAGPDSLALAKQRLAWIIVAMIALSAMSLLASCVVNVNYFSLNAMYRNRLVRAFLGASNIKPVTGQEPRRNPFHGFSEDDNPAMHELSSVGAGKAPFPVVNMTLNLTAIDDNAWQERKAAPFISTPLRSGGDCIGYRRSREYAGPISLGTAMSISGAAVSPNWGYHSSPLTSFLMTLFNIRLGAWLGNPSQASWKKQGPRNSFRLFWQEAVGHTTDKEPFVYLSDGGHFENLGLYEMVRRRCHTIVVSDAGADPSCKLQDLGNALRKIYVDLGVTIEFKKIAVRKRGPDPANPGIYCAIGTIKYPEQGASEGKVIYLKPGFYDDAPADVRAYAAVNAQFPHDTTLNQWFTESQFESYRTLGAHAIAKIAEKAPGGRVSLSDFVKCADNLETNYDAPKLTDVRLIS